MSTVIPLPDRRLSTYKKTCDMCRRVVGYGKRLNIVEPGLLYFKWYDGNHLCDPCFVAARLEGKL